MVDSRSGRLFSVRRVFDFLSDDGSILIILGASCKDVASCLYCCNSFSFLRSLQKQKMFKQNWMMAKMDNSNTTRDEEEEEDNYYVRYYDTDLTGIVLKI